jgi:potassium efflux system protein
VHVPDPSLGARVRHRLFAQIQKQFKEAGVAIPVPTHELLVKPMPDPRFSPFGVPSAPPRVDPAQPTPPAPWLASPAQPAPAPAEDCHRGVDE